jgi:hypothetical protein
MNGDLSESIFRPRRIIERQFLEASRRLAPWFRASNTQLKYILVCGSGLNKVYEADVIVDDDLKEVTLNPGAPIKVVSIKLNRFEIQKFSKETVFNRINLMRVANPVQAHLDRALNDLEKLEEALSDSSGYAWDLNVRSLPSYNDCCDLFFPKNVPLNLCQLETISESDTVNGVGTVTVQIERRGLQAFVLETKSDLGRSERWGLLFVFWHGNFPPPLPIPNPER